MSATYVVELFAAWCPDSDLCIQDMLTIPSVHVYTRWSRMYATYHILDSNTLPELKFKIDELMK